MQTEDLKGHLASCRKAAAAGAAVIRNAGRDIGAVRTKSSQTDVVTDIDIASGVAVVRQILADDPHARVVIEESEVLDLVDVARGDVTDAEVWVVDPLDGTTSFVHAFPCYSVSVALMRHGQPVAGAVYNAATDDLVSAARDMGTTLNDAVVCCGSVAKVSQALLVTGFPYDRGNTLDRQLEVLGRFLRTPVHGIRRDGSAAVDCCHVACGRADGFWEYGLQPWDTAAGVIICREAGAHVTGIEGEPWTPASTGIIVANAALHAAMTKVIRD